MPHLKKSGLIVCLSISAFAAACGDDDKADGEQRDATIVDSGTRDAEISIDASGDAGSIDAGSADAAFKVDATVPPVDRSLNAPSTDTYYVSLAPDVEVPPCENAGQPGNATFGTATVVVDEGRHSIIVTAFYSGLSGSPTAAHIHYGAAGTNGDAVLTFKDPNPPQDANTPFQLQQVFSAVDYKTPSSGPPTFTAFLSELKAGNAYLNVHTEACAQGELRGQIQ